MGKKHWVPQGNGALATLIRELVIPTYLLGCCILTKFINTPSVGRWHLILQLAVIECIVGRSESESFTSA